MYIFVGLWLALSVIKTYCKIPTYDYIIVGGGTAGSVLANRLSADPQIQVLLIEAGNESPWWADIPLLAPFLQTSELDWKYRTIPQSNACLEIKERKCRWPRGKALGGSSVINYMIYARGTKEDYDNWANNMGATGWSWDEVLPYFKKSEKNNDPDIMENGYHGINGEMSVERSTYFTPLVNIFAKAIEQLNYTLGDFNAAHPNRFMPPQNMMHNGRRVSTSTAFIEPIRDRPNLHIQLQAFVTKILFNNQSRAIGVQFDYQSKSQSALADKEVILSAGAISTPQLLMLSGIGPAEHLQTMGIPVISDLPVGKHLMDHLFTGVPFLFDPDAAFLFELFAGYVPAAAGQGPLASTLLEMVGFFNSKYEPRTNWPDVELMIFAVSQSSSPSVLVGTVTRRIQAMTDELWNKVFQPYSERYSFFCAPLLLHPLSEGEITLNSIDPYEHPKIDPKYLSNSEDTHVLREGVKKCFEFASTPALQRYNARPFNVTFPGCEKYERFTDEYFDCWVRVYTLTNYHPCGTCKMGSETDPTSVVDPSLRVLGVTGLRVVDASVIPYINTGHTAAVCIMIAEKASDMILEDYYNRCNP